MSKATQESVSTYYVLARVNTTLGTLEAKVAFGPGAQPDCRFVGTKVPGWNFSSLRTAAEMAEYAEHWLQTRLPDSTVGTVVVKESGHE